MHTDDGIDVFRHVFDPETMQPGELNPKISRSRTRRYRRPFALARAAHAVQALLAPVSWTPALAN